MSGDEKALTIIKHWINTVIIGLNFCPFAKKELERNTVRYQLCQANTINDALSQLLEELSLLDKKDDIQTTLLIFPNSFADFENYLDMVDLANVLIEQGGYRGIYQLATFHPDYCFEGEQENDPANFTNRSPYPVLHLLRESSIEAVLKRYPTPESIPINNIAKARELGADYLRSLVNLDSK